MIKKRKIQANVKSATYAFLSRNEGRKEVRLKKKIKMSSHVFVLTFSM